jgi:hypothetical protein
MRNITDEDVEAAFDWLRENAAAAAKAKAERVYLEEYRKSLKSIIMRECNVNIPVSAQERNAYADPRYIEHLKALKEAVFQDEKIRFLREAALAKIDAWRSASANERVRV